jgi:hypothetical protein
VSAHNLRGGVVLTGNQRTTRVRFVTPERDTDYFVTATVSALSNVDPSGPGTAATRASVRNKGTDGFDVCLEGPPGDLNGEAGRVTVDWMLLR